MSRGPFYDKGTYTGRVLRQALGTANSGNIQFTLNCLIVDRLENGQSVGVIEEKERTIYMVLTEKTVEMVTAQLEHLGYDKPSIKYLDPEIDGFHDFTDQEIELYCKHDEYNGEVREKWNISMPRGQREVQKAEPAALRKLDALFSKGLKANSAKKAPKPSKAAAVASGNGSDTDGDIPF